MKKAIIASVVGGLIIFIWQFLSFGLINFHKPAQQYTENQDAILSFLNTQNLPEGGYMLLGMPDGATMEQHEAAMKASNGKPWAYVQYHKSMDTNMGMNMIRGLLINMLLVYLFCWLVSKMNAPSSRQIFTCALVTGLIVFLNSAYTKFHLVQNI